MKFALVIHGSPLSSEAPHTALRFARACVAGGHSIYRVFFYQDGVHTGSRLAAPPVDESNIGADWAEFCESNNIDTVVCIAAAVRRGVLNAEEAKRYEKDADNLHQQFELSGLGQMVDAHINSDRLLVFGG